MGFALHTPDQVAQTVDHRLVDLLMGFRPSKCSVHMVYRAGHISEIPKISVPSIGEVAHVFVLLFSNPGRTDRSSSLRSCLDPGDNRGPLTIDRSPGRARSD